MERKSESLKKGVIVRTRLNHNGAKVDHARALTRCKRRAKENS